MQINPYWLQVSLVSVITMELGLFVSDVKQGSCRLLLPWEAPRQLDSPMWVLKSTQPSRLILKAPTYMPIVLDNRHCLYRNQNSDDISVQTTFEHNIFLILHLFQTDDSVSDDKRNFIGSTHGSLSTLLITFCQLRTLLMVITWICFLSLYWWNWLHIVDHTAKSCEISTL